MSAPSKDKSVKCSKAGGNFGGGDFGLGEPAYATKQSIEVELQTPNIAKMIKDGKEHIGTWTMIYDEGFEVRINSHKFFAFSKYEKRGYQSKSLCHETFPGWYHDATDPDDHSWGCYHGQKEQHGGEVVEHVMKDLDHAASLLEVPYKPELDLVAEVNARAGGKWKAKVYPEFAGKTMRELHEMGGRTLTQPFKALANNRQDPEAWSEEGDVFLQTAQEVSIRGLPKDFDWRNVDGENFVNPVENQGSCGSCYAHASMDALSSRVRIQTKNKVKPEYSINNILQCSEYSQGCAGGYGYLVGKYAQDFGVKSKGDATATKCSDEKDVVARASDYYYVGGFYGGSDWKSMMNELHKRGPIVVGFSTNGWIYHYESGIFLDETLRDESASKKAVHVNPWQHTDHAVIIVGWGEDKKDGKYWIVKNSWGKNWGEKGYFRIERGVNAQVIESKPVGFLAAVGPKVQVKDIYRQDALVQYNNQQVKIKKVTTKDADLEAVLDLVQEF